MVSRLRREKFDVVINLNGSDRSSWLTFFSGARERLGRVPGDGGPLFWRRMFTAHVECPPTPEPVYLQKCRCLAKAGFPSAPAGISRRNRGGKSARGGNCQKPTPEHIFTSARSRPPITRNCRRRNSRNSSPRWRKISPEKKLALSCAPTEREQKKMAALLALLPQKPWRVFAGNLNLTQIAAVIQHSALHFCGDTGPLHLAAMTNTPAVVWFWPNPGLREWVPTGEKYRVIVGANEPGAQYLGKIDTDDLIAAAQSVLKSAGT